MRNFESALSELMTQSPTPSKLRRFVRRYITPNTDRIINLVSLALGTISFVFALIVWRSPQPTPLEVVIRDVAIFTTLFSANIFLVYRYAYRSKAFTRARKYAQRNHSSASNALQNYKNELFDFFFDDIHVTEDPKIKPEQFKLFSKICFFVTSRTREAMKDYFQSKGIDVGDDIAITVKLVVLAGEVGNLSRLSEEDKQKAHTQQRWIITAYRDPITYNTFGQSRRVVNDNLYGIIGNTAFNNILNNGDEFFLGNNLASLKGAYKNENPKWNEHYNSTLVVPIWYKDTGSKRKVCFGFLAADSKNPDKEELFDEEGCLHIMRHSADLLALYYLSLFLYQHPPQAGNSTSATGLATGGSTPPPQ